MCFLFSTTIAINHPLSSKVIRSTRKIEHRDGGCRLSRHRNNNSGEKGTNQQKTARGFLFAYLFAQLDFAEKECWKFNE